jgi:hypothetical protein
VLYYLFCKTLICKEYAKYLLLFLSFSGLRPETLLLFANKEAKTFMKDA